MLCSALEVFKAWLVKALTKLVWTLSWPCQERRVGLGASWGPSQLGLSYDPDMESGSCEEMPRTPVQLYSPVLNSVNDSTTSPCSRVLSDSISSPLEFCRSSEVGLDLSWGVRWGTAALGTSFREGGRSSIVQWLRLQSIDALKLTLRELFFRRIFCSERFLYHSQRNREALTLHLNTRY